MLCAFLIHILPLAFFMISPPTIPIIVALVLPILGDITMILAPLLRRIERRDLLRYFTLFEVYYFVYTTAFALLAVLPVRIR